MSGGVWGAVADGAIQIGTAWLNSESQRRTNRTNIKLQREQQGWQERMSNSEIQRRVADITAAGGNPALAFTNGQGASSPTMAPARVEAPRADIKTNFTGAMVAKAQIENMNADTLEKLASARSKKVQADIDETAKNARTESTVNKHVEEFEQADLKTKIMRHLDASTAAEAKRQEGTVESMIQAAKQQAETGKLNLEALRNIANMGGIEANQLSPIMKIITSILLEAMKD